MVGHQCALHLCCAVLVIRGRAVIGRWRCREEVRKNGVRELRLRVRNRGGSGRRVAFSAPSEIILTTPPPDSMSLIGSWKLLSWEIRSSDGVVSMPVGENPRGIITYDGTGRMAVQLMRTDRLRSESSDPFGASPDEIVAAWMGFISYAGTYENDVARKRVVHHLEISSFPNWVGSRQERFYDFDGDLLVLSTPPISLGGESAVSTLFWERL